MYHVPLGNTAFEGRNSVYLLGADGDGPVTLVDAGVASPDTEADLRDALAVHDIAFADVDRVLLTHWHHDHAGLAGAIQSESDCEVVAHEADAPLVAGDPDALDDMQARQQACLDAWGMPPAKQDEILAFFEGSAGLAGDPVDVTTVVDGDTVTAGPHDLDVVHLPGHAAGLVGYLFEREGRREGFLGDAVLPKYTPNVGGADVRVDRPLATYLASLDRVADADLDRSWPGHRGPIFATTERCRDIQRHHGERTRRVVSVVAAHEPVTAWEVSAELFGDLHGIHVLHGPGEAHAHLDHLVADDLLAATEDGYVTTPRTPDPERAAAMVAGDD